MHPALTRHAAACAIIFDDQGRILLQRRADNGRWSLPGGAIEPDESAASAAVCETHEETGYHIDILRLIGIYSDPAHTTFRSADGTHTSYIAIAFEGRITGGAPRTCSESVAIAWFDPDQLPAETSDNHRPRIADALCRKAAAFFR